MDIKYEEIIKAQKEFIIEESNRIVNGDCVKFHQFATSYAKVFESIIDDTRKGINPLILYHSDLDGMTSYYATENYLCHASFCKVRPIPMRINYGYNTDIYEQHLNDADGNPLKNTIIVVDYSLSENQKHNNHLQWLYDKMEKGHKVVWIDHHASSLSTINNNDKDSLSYKFMHNYNLINYFYTKTGVSAALLCELTAKCAYTIYLNYNLYFDCEKHTDMPEPRYFNVDGKVKVTIDNVDVLYDNWNVDYVGDFITSVSLYDTFHPLSQREFSTAAHSIKIDPQTLYEESLSDADKSGSPILNLNVLFDREHMKELYDRGSILVEHEKMINNMNLKSQFIQFNLKVNGTVYKIGTINKPGNSFIFEDKYNECDAVMPVYMDNIGVFRYSMYAREYDGDNPPCKIVAERFGGGGHAHAAGWQLNEIMLPYIVNVQKMDGVDTIIELDELVDKFGK